MSRFMNSTCQARQKQHYVTFTPPPPPLSLSMQYLSVRRQVSWQVFNIPADAHSNQRGQVCRAVKL